MKKHILIFSIILLGLYCTGCVHMDYKRENTVVVLKNSDSMEIKSGDVIVADRCNIVIKDVEFFDRTPPDRNDLFDTYHIPDRDRSYLCLSADVTNTAKQKLPYDQIGTVMIDCSRGCRYRSFVVRKGTLGRFSRDNRGIDPLSTQEIQFLIECPREVIETQHPLKLILMIEGRELIYTVK